MNTNFVAVIKRIIAEEGEGILGEPARLKGYVADYAAAESKAERLAFGRCIEYGAYNELKNAPDITARQAAKAALARRVNANEGIDLALCNGVLDVLEAALFDTTQNIPIQQTNSTGQTSSIPPPGLLNVQRPTKRHLWWRIALIVVFGFLSLSCFASILQALYMIVTVAAFFSLFAVILEICIISLTEAVWYNKSLAAQGLSVPWPKKKLGWGIALVAAFGLFTSGHLVYLILWSIEGLDDGIYTFIPSLPFIGTGLAFSILNLKMVMRHNKTQQAAPGKNLSTRKMLIALGTVFAGVFIGFFIAGKINEPNRLIKAGDGYILNSDYDSAIAEFTAAIKLRPGLASAYVGRGRAYYFKEEYDIAIKDYTEAIRFDPGLAEAYMFRGRAYYFKGEYDAAINDLNEAIRLDPNDSSAYMNRGHVNFAERKYDAAFRDYVKAIEIEFKKGFRPSPSHLEYGQQFFEEGEYDIAFWFFDEAIRLDTDGTFYTAYTTRAKAYYRIGLTALALQDLDKAEQAALQSYRSREEYLSEEQAEQNLNEALAELKDLRETMLSGGRL
jgi:tetratricopeptide (TPR) repeat protein